MELSCRNRIDDLAFVEAFDEKLESTWPEFMESLAVPIKFIIPSLHIISSPDDTCLHCAPHGWVTLKRCPEDWQHLHWILRWSVAEPYWATYLFASMMKDQAACQRYQVSQGLIMAGGS